MDLDPDILSIFLLEARGYLSTLTSAAVPDEDRHRAAHGLKGAAGLSGQLELAGVAARMVELVGQGDESALAVEIGRAEVLLEDLERGEPAATTTATATMEAPDDPWDEETAALLTAVFVEEAREHVENLTSALISLERPAAEATAADLPHKEEELLRGLMRAAHTLKGSAATVGQDAISQGAHMMEELLTWVGQDPRRVSQANASADLLIQAADVLGSMVTAVEGGKDPAGMLDELKELLTRIQQDEAEHPDAADERRRRERRLSQRRGRDLHRIRVDPGRLDELMDQGGELLIHRTRLERRAEELRTLSLELATVRRQLHSALVDARGPEHQQVRQRLAELEVDLTDRAINLERGTSSLADDCQALRRTSQALQEQLARLYLTPISLLHARLQRPAREMARAQGKQLELIIRDEASEMPRSVVEQITTPLIQLLRNAVVHGIETPEQRLAVGKPAAGKVEITARFSGDVVYLEVSDDGAGVDPAALRRAIKERLGSLSDEDLDRLSDEEVLYNVFLNGLSTLAEADLLAGRGVGLDLVRQHISQLGGDIRLQSQPGQGTRFFIQMPLITTTAQALLFKVGDRDFGLPVAHIEQVLSPSPEQVERQGEGYELLLSGERMPLLSLWRLLGMRSDGAAGPPSHVPSRVIVIRLGELRFGVTCTRVTGTRQVVLKGLGSLLAPHPLFAAATVRSDSSVTFVLDVGFLARAASLAPLDLSSLPIVARRQASSPAAAAPGLRGRTILFCDDSRSVREAVGHLLTTLGHPVETASDGREAWEKLRLGPYRLLITDLEMPELHGLDLIARCREEPSLSAMPIVVLTSRSSAQSRMDALERGAHSFLAKPVGRAVLKALLEELLETH